MPSMRSYWLQTIAGSDGLVHLAWSYPKDIGQQLGETACEEPWVHVGTSKYNVAEDIIRAVDTDKEPSCLTCIAVELF